jgi:hypothetical protein
MIKLLLLNLEQDNRSENLLPVLHNLSAGSHVNFIIQKFTFSHRTFMKRTL